MAERVALWGRDIDESPADLDDGYVAAGQPDPITEPIGLAEDDDTRDIRDHPVGSASRTLTFKPAAAPWYRDRRGLVVLIAVIAVAVVLALVPMLLKGSGPGSEEPTNAPPTTAGPAPTSAQPTSNSNAPTLTSRSAPPPPPSPPQPPPPPPTQEAPVYVPQYPGPRSGSSSEQAKPEIGVTRAPISVSPKPVTPPTSAAVGDNGTPPRRGHWGF